MSITKEVKADLVKKFQLHDQDDGSTEVQIAILTKRIRNLTEHFKAHKKDYAGTIDFHIYTVCTGHIFVKWAKEG